MSTALQRLLARPLSHAFLQYLTQTQTLEHALQRASNGLCTCAHNFRSNEYTTKATSTPFKELWALGAIADDASTTEPRILKSTGNQQDHEPTTSFELANKRSHLPTLDVSGSPTITSASLGTHLEAEFLSDICPQSDNGGVIIFDSRFGDKFTFWASLLESQQQQYGDAGVAKFWAAVRKRGILLPTEGSAARRMWPIFLQVGFEKTEMLSDICEYADELFDNFGIHWSKFYVYIIQHMILKGDQSIIVLWHERLIERHPPGPDIFSKFVRNVIIMGVNMGVLKSLYNLPFFRMHSYYKTYGKIIPALIERGDFDTAMEWHSFLVTRGDYSRHRKVVEPLIRHFEKRDIEKAKILTDSLAPANVALTGIISDSTERSEVLSREAMNLVHGKAFGIEPKKYSDRLGARWFATTWISLDLAVNTIHALGVQEIGPLSLQAISLRQTDDSGVKYRIDQLKELGISIGDSVFSKSVQHFARNGDIEHLQGLLRSDQHPDSYEDRELQENLLAAYARAGDWARFRLTAAIEAVASDNPHVVQYNLMLRESISRGDQPAIFRMLEEMRMERVPVNPRTISHLLRHILPRRRLGFGPNPFPASLNALRSATSILTTIMKYGGFVHPNSWREIIRRFGMLGRFNDLEKLCYWLAAWYQPKRTTNLLYKYGLLRIKALRYESRAPMGIPTSYRSHPLRMLFSNPCQRAIVEWAFKHEPLRQPSKTANDLDEATNVDKLAEISARHYTRGVKLLRQLQDQGVYIDMAQMRRALRIRIAILFSSRKSRIVRNTLLRRQNVSSKEDVVTNLNRAWGSEIWPDDQCVTRKRRRLLRSKKESIRNRKAIGE